MYTPFFTAAQLYLKCQLTGIPSYTFDLEHAVPYFDMPEDERKNIWDDPVHFTAKGSCWISRGKSTS